MSRIVYTCGCSAITPMDNPPKYCPTHGKYGDDMLVTPPAAPLSVSSTPAPAVSAQDEPTRTRETLLLEGAITTMEALQEQGIFLHDARGTVLDKDAMIMATVTAFNHVLAKAHTERSSAASTPAWEPDLVRQVLIRATEFKDLPAPEALIEEDGDFCFDWDVRVNATISLSISPSGKVGWAALIGDYTSHGTFQFPEWADECDRAFSRLQIALQTPLPAPPASPAREKDTP